MGPQTQKLSKSKKYKARRTCIFDDSDPEEVVAEQEVKIEMNEEVKIEEEEDEDETSRKRSFVEPEMDLDEPPLKKRKLEETKRIIMSKGVDLFVDMLENGNEDIQNALVDLIQQFEAN